MPASGLGPNHVVARWQQARAAQALTHTAETGGQKHSCERDLKIKTLGSLWKPQKFQRSVGEELMQGGTFWGRGGSGEHWASCFCYSHMQCHEVKIGAHMSLSSSLPCAPCAQVGW